MVRRMEQFRFIWQYIRRHKGQYIGGIITLFILDFANLYIPKTTGVITDGLAAHTMDMRGVLGNIGIIFGIGLTLAVGRFLWRYFLFGAARSIEHELRDDLFRHLETLDVEYYHEHKTGDLMTRFTSDLNAVLIAIGPAVISAFDAVVMTVMVIGQMMLYVNFKLTLAAVIPMVLIAFGELYCGKLMQKRFQERQEAVSELTDFVQESFSGVRVVKAFVRERAQIKAFAKANANAKKKNLRIARLEAVVIPLLDVVIGVSSLLTLLYGGHLVLTGEITIGRFVAFNQYIMMLVWPMIACGDAINSFSRGGASIKRLQEIFDEEPRIADGEHVVCVDGLRGDIRMNHLDRKSVVEGKECASMCRSRWSP